MPKRAPRVGALRARSFQVIGVFAGEAGLLGACSSFPDTLLARARASRPDRPRAASAEARPVRRSPSHPRQISLAQGLCPVPVIRGVSPGARRPAPKELYRPGTVSDVMPRDRIACAAGKARGAKRAGLFERRATPPAGMPRPGIMSRITGTGHWLSAAHRGWP